MRGELTFCFIDSLICLMPALARNCLICSVSMPDAFVKSGFLEPLELGDFFCLACYSVAGLLSLLSLIWLISLYFWPSFVR
jgi:hypothetical protein